MPGKIGIIVQARMGSSRLPGKSLKKIGEKPLIWYVIKRLEQLKLPVIIATSTDPSDDILVNYLKEQDFLFYRGSLNNVLQRYIDTAEAFDLKKIIRVTGDNPLVDVDYLLDSLPLFNEFSYVDGIYKRGLIKGTGFELVSLRELKNIPSTEEQHLEHVTLWLRENLVGSPTRTLLVPLNFNKYREDIFLSCDYIEDLMLLRKIFAAFQFRTGISLQELLEFHQEYSNLFKLNASLHK